MSAKDEPAATPLGAAAPARLQRVLDTLDESGVHLLLVSPEGRVLWASPSLMRTRGEGLIGAPCHPSIFRRESDCIPCHREKVIATGQPFRCWIPERRPGRFGPRQMLVQMRTPGGNLLEALIEAGPADRLFYDQIFRERVLSEGLRHVASGVLVLDGSMRVVSANPAAAQLLARSESRLRGTPLEELLPAGVLPASGKELATFLAVETGFERVEVALGEPLHPRIVHLSLAAIGGPDERLTAAVAILTDLTEETRVGQALKRKVGELTLLQEIGDLLTRVSRLDQVLRVLLSAVVHPGGLGLSHAALFLCEDRDGIIRGRLARRRAPFLLPSARQSLAAELQAMALGDEEAWEHGHGGELTGLKIPLAKADHPLVATMTAGVVRRIELNGEEDSVEPRLGALFGQVPALLAPLSSNGHPLGVLVGVRAADDPPIDGDRLALAGMIADRAAGAIARARLHDELAERLAELREAHARQSHLQGQLLRAEKLSAIGELAAEIVHEIRNPLAVVGGFARRLARSTDDKDPRASDLRVLIEEADRMETILARIRREVRDARTPARESVDADEVVGAAIARYRSLAREQGIRLEAEVEEKLPAVRGSRDLLLEVLDNLVRNAFDAVGEEGRVRVCALRLKEAVHIVVEDDGPGLDAEQLEQVFEPFYTTKLEGTGLGLPLAKRLVLQCGGSLSVDSRPGEGARFRIVMPTAPESAGERARSAEATERRNEHGHDPDRR